MNAEQWVRSTFRIVDDCIDWGDGVYTPISTFLSFFSDIINKALVDGQNPKQVIIKSDPNNEKGFNRYLS